MAKTDSKYYFTNINFFHDGKSLMLHRFSKERGNPGWFKSENCYFSFVFCCLSLLNTIFLSISGPTLALNENSVNTFWSIEAQQL